MTAKRRRRLEVITYGLVLTLGLLFAIWFYWPMVGCETAVRGFIRMKCLP